MTTSISIDGKQSAPDTYSLGNGKNWRGIMFSIRHKTGNRTAYPYAYIQKISYDPSTGIVVELPEETIVLRGSNLQEVYMGLLNQIIHELYELDPTYQRPGDQAFISRVEIRTKHTSARHDE